MPYLRRLLKPTLRTNRIARHAATTSELKGYVQLRVTRRNTSLLGFPKPLISSSVINRYAPAECIHVAESDYRIAMSALRKRTQDRERLLKVPCFDGANAR